MVKTAKRQKFIKEFILLFGFLGGFWIYAGVNPEAEIAKAFMEIVESLIPGTFTALSVLYWIGSLIFMSLSFWSSYLVGGKAGLIAVILAFLGGILIGSVGIWFLVAALILGLFI